MFTPGTVLLHDNRDPDGRSLLFSGPRELLVAHDAEAARAAMARLARAPGEGLWAAGYLAYELGFLFEERLAHLLPAHSATPLCWIGLYDAPQSPDVAALLAAAPQGRAEDVRADLDLPDYAKAFERVKTLIAAGDAYQINLTMKARFRLAGHPLGLYRTLSQSQKVAYGAYIHAGDHHVLSRSPELFVSGSGGVLTARPMKGTLRRGNTRAEDEYAEALLKLAFLSDPVPPVTLIETFKWTPEDGYALRERHLDRLTDSAAYFSLPVTREEAAAFLAEKAAGWTAPMRVRLTLSDAGLDLAAVPLPPTPDRFRFAVHPEPLDSGALWLAHKTTNRAFYDQPRQRAHDKQGLDELVFRNERDELTEGSFTNLFIARDGTLLTPPLSSGLLPGTLRAELIATGRAKEAVLTLADLTSAEAIFLGNSVRGLVPAEWIKEQP